MVKLSLGLPDPIDALVLRNKDEDADDDEPEGEGDYGNHKRPKKAIVDTTAFNLCGGLVIFANAITVGLETDAVALQVSEGKVIQLDPIWQIVETVFCIVFLLELLLRLYYHRLNYFLNVHTFLWNWVDFIIVVASSIDTLVLSPLGVGGAGKLVSLMRFIRMLRLARLVRLLKLFKELWLMVSGIMQSLKTLGWISVVAFVFSYAWAIYATKAIGFDDATWDGYFMTSRGWDHEEYFGSVWKSTFTMVQLLTLTGWSEEVVRHIEKGQPMLLIFFIFFVCVSSLGLLSIMVGVVVENTLTTARRDQAKAVDQKDKDRKVVFAQLQEVFEVADVDGSGTLTIEEVEEAIGKSEIYNKLKMIDFPVDDPNMIFSLLDYDDSGELTIDEFITGCIRMKGAAKSKDLLVAQVAIDSMKRHFAKFETEMARFQAKVSLLQESASAITGHGEHTFLEPRMYRNRHPEFANSDIPHMSDEALEMVPWKRDEMEVRKEEHEVPTGQLGLTDAHLRFLAIANEEHGEMQTLPPGAFNATHHLRGLEDGQSTLPGSPTKRQAPVAIQDLEQSGSYELAVPGSTFQNSS